MELTSRTSSCTGKHCGYNISVSRQSIGCSSGDGSCLTASFARLVDGTTFYDADLDAASEKINEILGQIPDRKNVRLLATHKGVVLARVQHTLATETTDVTRLSSETEIENALSIA